MSLLSFLNGKTSSSRADATTQRMNAVVGWLYLAILFIAVVCAIKDGEMYGSSGIRGWLLVLAILFPDLYIIMHGLSAASMNQGFFSGIPMTESPASNISEFGKIAPPGSAAPSDSDSIREFLSRMNAQASVRSAPSRATFSDLSDLSTSF